MTVREQRGGAPLRVVLIVLVLAVVAGGALWATGSLPFTGDADRAGDEDVGPGRAVPPSVVSGITAPSPAPAPPVLRPLRATGPGVTSAQVRATVAPLLRSKNLGASTGIVVTDLRSDRVLWRSGPQTLVPASTNKILTAVAALSALGPAHRFSTTVVQGGDPSSIVLVGGGDPLLTVSRAREVEGTYPRRATLAELAARTARSLRQRRTIRVRLTYDDSLFTGPSASPQWRPSYVPDGVVSPISALWVDEGRVRDGYDERSPDPSRAAAEQFARLLAQRGITVTGSPRPSRAPRVPRPPRRGPGALLGEVSSPPLDQIVQYVLEASDNEGSEVLLRQAGLATGRDGSFAGGTRAVRARLQALGIDVSGLRTYDGSGLSRLNQVPLGVLTSVVSVAAGPRHPELRTVVTGLPVAGWTGSLADDFLYSGTTGLGRVHGKTGTLTGVHALAGTTTTRQGQLLGFAVVTNDVRPNQEYMAPVQVYRIAGALPTL